jgi:hypothetical protein
VLVVGVSGDEVFGRDEAAGVDAVHLVEGMDGEFGELEAVAGTRGSWDEARSSTWRGGFGFG